MEGKVFVLGRSVYAHQMCPYRTTYLPSDGVSRSKVAIQADRQDEKGLPQEGWGVFGILDLERLARALRLRWLWYKWNDDGQG